MKKSVAVILTLLLTLSLLCVCSSATQTADYKIVISDSATEQEKYASEVLRTCIEGITNIDVAILTEKPSDEKAVIFYIGDTDYFDTSAVDGKADGSYVIEPVSDGVAIYGAGNRGTIYGVYGYGEKYLGYHCYYADSGFVTAQTEIRLAEEKTEYTPYFEYTDTDWKSPRDVVYSLANGLNGSPCRSIPQEQGGTVNYISGFAHTLTTEFCNGDKYFSEHPEYFALRDGNRTSAQLCLSNDEVYELVLSEVLNLLEQNHNPEESLQIISLTQNDNDYYCQCDKCREIDEANGSQSGTIITFANRIAKAVKQAGYDNVAIDTFAYQYSRKAPTNVIPEDNVIVRLCTIECCFSHPLCDESCEQNARLMKDLSDWGKICDRIYIWDYTTNYHYTLGIFPDFEVLQSNIQTFYENGAKGIYEEGAYYVNDCDDEFAELRAYLIAKLLQNPYCDIETEMLAFCNSYYGQGGDSIVKIIHLLCENAKNTHAEIYMSMSETFSLTDEQVAETDTLWNSAKAEADGVELEHINRSELSWRFVKSSLGLGEFGGLVSKKISNIRLYNDMTDMGIIRFDENVSSPNGKLNLDPFYFFNSAEDWRCSANNDSASGYTVAFVFYASALFAGLILFITAIIKKKYLYCLYLPTLLLISELAMLNQKLFYAWQNLGLYFSTVALAMLIIGLMTLGAVRGGKNSKKKCRKISVLSAVLFLLCYEGPVLIINNLLNGGGANAKALSVSFCLCALLLCVLTVCSAVNVVRTKKKNCG